MVANDVFLHLQGAAFWLSPHLPQERAVHQSDRAPLRARVIAYQDERRGGSPARNAVTSAGQKSRGSRGRNEMAIVDQYDIRRDIPEYGARSATASPASSIMRKRGSDPATLHRDHFPRSISPRRGDGDDGGALGGAPRCDHSKYNHAGNTSGGYDGDGGD